MGFSGPFREPIIAPIFSPGGVVTVTPWYLLGGVTSAQCVAAYQPKGAASYAASKININLPGTHDATDGVATPTWSTSVGWSVVTASSQYLVTDITPSDETWSYLIQFNNASSNPGRLFGMLATVGSLYIQPNSGGSRIQYANGSGTVNNATPQTSAANAAMAGPNCYRNGAADGSIGAGAFTGAREIWIGGQNNGGTGSSFITGNIVALAIYNITLSSTQVGLIAPAMAAL